MHKAYGAGYCRVAQVHEKLLDLIWHQEALVRERPAGKARYIERGPLFQVSGTDDILHSFADHV
jgi:hypothetical protein